MPNMKKFVSVLLCSLLSVALLAQSSVSLVTLARAEISRRGLEEEEVRARLLENGIDVESIPRADYRLYQQRIISIIDQMQAEKEAADKDPDGTGTGNNAQTSSLTEATKPTLRLAPQTTRSEEIAEHALKKALTENDTAPHNQNDIYGHKLFTGKSMDVFRTTDGAQAPDTYVLGIGDEVHISIFGSSQTEIHQRIEADGSIQPAGITKIFLKGLTLAQARNAIKSKLAQHYSFRQDQIAVTIGTARTVTVNIYGEVGVQGGFNLSALNTAFNALAAAGGLSPMGSLRNIQRSRGGQTTRLDLYKFMTGQVSADQYDLQNNDIIFVPVAEKIVSIEGAVNRPMRYEMTDGETVNDLIRYAGGLAYGAYTSFVQIERYNNGEKELLEYDLESVMNGTRHVQLVGGDIVRIKNAGRTIENYVYISGEVYYGGSFNLETNRSLKALLENAKPRHTARTDYLFVERTRNDETVEVLTVPFPGTGNNPDFILQARDSVRVMALSRYTDVDTLYVNGQVRQPFKRTFSKEDHISVGQAIDMAGGLKPSVYPVAYIFRKDPTNEAKMEYIPISVTKDLDVLLQAGDRLHIYDNSTYTNIGEVRISGAIKDPIATTFDASLSVHDLILMAGGAEVGAALDRVEVFRVNLDKGPEAKFDRISIKVDENYYPVEPFDLQPYDHIVVRQMVNFALSRTVEINGRVRYPGVYVLEDSRTQLSEIIKMAGGMLNDASPYCTLFRTYNNRGSIGLNLKDAKRHKNDINYDPILMEGDVINVVRQENTVSIRETGTRMAQYLPDDMDETQRSFVYHGRHSAKWYIYHYGGGFQKYTDRNSVTVTLPNNQSVGTKKFLWMNVYPTVEPGSVITMSIDTKRQEKAKEPKEKVRWDQVAASTLSALTSVVSMIVLIERLN